MTLRKLISAGILGVSLAALSGLPTLAQEKAMDNPYENVPDEEFKTPVWAMTYPMAAPGSVHLMHWHGYDRQTAMAGSVNDFMAEKNRRMDKMYRDTRATYWNKMSDSEKMQWEEARAYPISFSYPMASPASLHLMHWHGLDRQEMMAGSVNDMMYMTEREKDKMWRDEMMKNPWTEAEMEMRAEPLDMTYPMAAPGSLHLYHFKDYRRGEIMSGSAWEHRMERDKMMMDKARMESMTGNSRRP